jgi:hypothetical protein
MSPKSFDLVSPLSRDECVRRLRAKTKSPWVPAVFSDEPLDGDVENTWFRLRKRIAYGNPFQPHLSGELLDEDGRTRVLCRYEFRLTVVIFMAIWFGGVLIGGGAVALRGHTPAAAWAAITCTAFMVAGGVGFIGLGLLFARNERQFLIDILHDAIVAREA